MQGLQNTGATCYFNSLMQALLSCEISGSDLINKINSVYNCGINNINASLKSPMPPGQQCPLELLDRIAETCDVFAFKIRIRYKETTTCPQCRKRIEHGELVGNLPREKYHYHNITNGNMTLSKPIKSAMLYYINTINYNCECGSKIAYRDHRLKRIGDVLILQYPHTGQYITSLLHAKYIDPQNAKKLAAKLRSPRPVPKVIKFEGISGDRVYELRAMIKHVGATPQSGHYWCVCYRDGEWWRANDSSISKTTYAAECRDVVVAFYRLR